ncbi:MAG: hypothetical protein E6I96_10670 [Chloroflexi bacterium]|nr:MAG: hypothetical protein E6I96_10670 [Chloroflexota bacterium]
MMQATSKLFLLGTALLGLLPMQASAEVVPNVDLAIISNKADVKHAHVGQQVTFTIVATNNGPDSALSLYVSYTDLEGMQPVDEICDFGISADTPSCEYADIAVGQTVTTKVVAEIVSTGAKSASATACVSSADAINDPNPANDCATATVKIVGKR